jgi:hypothetical protein
MSETSEQIVSLIVSKQFNKAKNLITESMNEKLGLLLEEKLMEYAPTLFEESDKDGGKDGSKDGGKDGSKDGDKAESFKGDNKSDKNKKLIDLAQARKNKKK